MLLSHVSKSMKRRALLISLAALSGCATNSSDAPESTSTPSEPNFQIEQVSLSPGEIRVNDDVTLEAIIKNAGQASGSAEYVLSVANKIVGEGDLPLNKGEQQTVSGSFDTSPYHPQEISYRVDIQEEVKEGSFQLLPNLDEYFESFHDQMEDYTTNIEWDYNSSKYVIRYVGQGDSVRNLQVEIALFVGAFIRQIDRGLPPRRFEAEVYSSTGTYVGMWFVKEDWIRKYQRGEFTVEDVTMKTYEEGIVPA